MKSRNHGHLVSINSMIGLIGLGGAADYCASKFGANGLSESLNMELVGAGLDGIEQSVIYPYLIDTDMFAGVQPR